MPQGGGPLTSANSISSSSSSTATSSVSDSASSSQASSSAEVTQRSLSQSLCTLPATPTTTPTLAGFPSQQHATIAIDGRLFGLTGGPISGANGAQMVKLVQQAMASAGVLGGGGGLIAAPVAQGQIPSSNASSENLGKKNDEVKKPDDSAGHGGSMAPAVFPPQAMPFNQMYLTPSGLVMPQIYTMKVEDPVPVGKVSLESTSIELTGQVPIKKIDRETMDVVKTTDGGGQEQEREGKEGLVLSSGVEEKGAREVDKEGRKMDAGKKGVDGKDKESEGVMEKTVEGEGKVTIVAGGAQQKPKDPSGSGFLGHSTADIRSAELLLSLTGGSAKSWPVTPPKKGAGQKESSGGLITSSPSSGDPHTPSSGRKRKQKPIASAKPSAQSERASGKDDATAKADISLSMPKAKRARKTKKNVNASEESAAKQNTGKEGVLPKKSKEFTPQELLEILNIPPSSGPDKSITVAAPGECILVLLFFCVFRISDTQCLTTIDMKQLLVGLGRG